MSKWEQGKYSSSSRRVGFITLSVRWDAMKGAASTDPNWAANLNGYDLKRRFQTEAEAMAAVEQVAERELRKALEDLTGEKEGTE